MRGLLRRLAHDERWRDVGLLVLRAGLGLAMIAHGWPKLVAGPEKWAKLGTAMASMGIDFAPVFWGFAAAVAETVGGLCLAIGLGTRVAAAALAFTMLVAGVDHWRDGQPFTGWSHALEDGIAFVALALLGGGRYAVERRIL